MPSSRDAPDPEMEPPPLTFPALVAGSLPLVPSGKPPQTTRNQVLIMLTFLKAFIFNREQCVRVNPKLPIHPPVL